MSMDFPIGFGLTGDIKALTHSDPVAPPNTVLEIDREWFVNVQWYVDGAAASFLGGQWQVSVIVESMGIGDEKTLVSESYLTTDTSDIPGEMHSLEYNKEIRIPPRAEVPLDPIRAIQAEGVYKLIVLVTYLTPFNQHGRIAGFAEGPVLQFYHFDVPL